MTLLKVAEMTEGIVCHADEPNDASALVIGCDGR